MSAVQSVKSYMVDVRCGERATGFLTGPLVVTSTPLGGEPVTLLSVAPSQPPSGRMTVDQWRKWVAADQDRMLKEFEAWANAFVLAMCERAHVYDGH